MPARLWSELEPWERRAELVKVHPELNEDCLIACGRAVPELAPQIKAQRSKEDQLKVVLRYFGDEENPQPEGVVRYGPAINGNPAKVSPRWERLPPLDETGKVKAKKPRYRPPGEIAEATIKQLKMELTKRRAHPKDPELTQEKIAARVGLDRSRVVQAGALEKAGWDLLRSHPDFSTTHGFVRWPSAEDAARLLASRRVEN